MPSVNGIAEMNAAAARMIANIRQASSAAALAGANVVAEEIRRLAPDGPTHKLRDSVVVAELQMDGGAVRAVVTVGGPQAPEATWMEFGAAAHQIAPKRASALHFGNHFASSVHHPGVAPRPFVRSAIVAKKAEATSAVIAVLQNALK